MERLQFLRVKNRVELQKTAKVNIDLVCKYLIVEEGVIFDGTCSMSKQELFDKNAKGKTE
jgi:cytoskeletal protein CcmA (bactofilin family)